MTVGENIFLGKEPRNGPAIDWNKLYADTDALLKRYKLDISPHDAGQGPRRRPDADDRDRQGALRERQGPDPRRAHLRPLRGRGGQAHGDPARPSRPRGSPASTSRHKLEEFFRITDTVTVLRDGKVVTTQPTAELTVEKLVNLMVGREMKERFPKGEPQARRGLLPGRGPARPRPQRPGPGGRQGRRFRPPEGRDPRHRRPHGLRPHRAGHHHLRRIRRSSPPAASTWTARRSTSTARATP